MNQYVRCCMIIFFGFTANGCGGEANADSPFFPIRPISPKKIETEILFSAPSTDNVNGELFKQSAVIQNQVDFENKLLNFTSETPDQINFDDNQVLFLSMGLRTTGGYSIEVNDELIETSTDFVKINVSYIEPGVNCLVTLALTSPYLVLLVPTQKEILLNETIESTDCSETE